MNETMKKRHYFFIFIICCLGLSYFFKQSLMNQYIFYKVEQSPAYTAVTDTKLLIERENGSFEGVWVDFYYVVEGKQYNFRSLNTTREIAEKYMTAEECSTVAYAKNNPSLAMLKYHYDMWQKEGNRNDMTTIMIGFIVIVSFVFTLLIALVNFLRKRAKKNKA